MKDFRQVPPWPRWATLPWPLGEDRLLAAPWPLSDVMQSINPATGEIIGSYPEMSLSEAGELAQLVERASLRWRRESLEERAKLVGALGRRLSRSREPLSQLIAAEMGKPIREALAEVEKCAAVCAYYAEHGPRFLAPEPVHTEAEQSYVCYEALGVVLAIMPWNFPLWQVFRCAAPALLAGNGLILKHAPNVSGCSLAIEGLLAQTDQRDLLRSAFLTNDDTLALIDHPSIAAVTLTGSTRAGRQVAARAGAALKKSVLELGGSDPYLVLADADIELASRVCVQSRLINAGQSCIAAKRFIVVPEQRARFEAAVVELMRAVVQGDPLDVATELGPLARVDLRDQLHTQVLTSIERGASLLLGGLVPEGPGAWYTPTVLANVLPGMPAADEELFGPVAAIMPAESEAHAIKLANQTDYGLGSAVFTSDRRRGEQIVRQEVLAGSGFVNTFVRSDPRLPFGGVKQSGYGRELGVAGVREFVNVKTVYVA